MDDGLEEGLKKTVIRRWRRETERTKGVGVVVVAVAVFKRIKDATPEYYNSVWIGRQEKLVKKDQSKDEREWTKLKSVQ